MKKTLDDAIGDIIARASNPPVPDPVAEEAERRKKEEDALRWNATVMIAGVVGTVLNKASDALSAAHVETCSTSGGGAIRAGDMILDKAEREMRYATSRDDHHLNGRVTAGQFGVGHVGIVASRDGRTYREVARYTPQEVAAMLADKNAAVERMVQVIADAMSGGDNS